MSGVFKKKSKQDKLIAAAIRRELVQNPEDALLIAQAMISRAKGGDVVAAVYVRDTIDGKPTQQVEIEHDVADNVKMIDEKELAEALRKRLSGLLPQAVVPDVDGDREPGTGGKAGTH